ncbi:MAG: EAL domain-containing response regulator [Alphaproteobacteria bacterium]|nr:EAL domain-containing response regulator [Alphaproteobacteria bacterium]
MDQLRALIVDDDKFMINLTTRMLNKIGITTVSSALDGQSGLDALAEAAPNVILLDLNMPGMDGLEFLRHLSEREVAASVILVSGEDKRVLQTAYQLAQAHQLTVLGALQKPVKPDPLKALLEKVNAEQERRKRGPIPLVPVEELEAGIHFGSVEAHFQPKVSVADKKLVGVETLVRWRGADGKLVPPVAFISVAENNGLIDALTEKVFLKAVSCASDWMLHGLDIKVAVNFSVESLTRFDLVQFVIEASEDAGVDLSRIVFEVTESRIMEDIAAPLEVLTRLRMKGIGLSIDDFGTGASSMQQLKRAPFTELKIDRAFVAGANHDEEARAMLESSVDLARRLGLSTVAEGVETQAEWDIVAELGVDVVQGYFIARPMPADELLDWARARGDLPPGE